MFTLIQKLNRISMTKTFWNLFCSFSFAFYAFNFHASSPHLDFFSFTTRNTFHKHNWVRWKPENQWQNSLFMFSLAIFVSLIFCERFVFDLRPLERFYQNWSSFVLRFKLKFFSRTTNCLTMFQKEAFSSPGFNFARARSRRVWEGSIYRVECRRLILVLFSIFWIWLARTFVALDFNLKIMI